MNATKIHRSIAILTCALLATTGLAATEADEIVARARAFLGSEAALDSVKSIRFSGTIAEGTEPRGSIVITLKKPFQQRIERTIGDEREVTALDDFDGWSRRENLTNPEELRLTLLSGDHIRRLQANNVENLNFFKGTERRGGSVEVRGDATIDDIACVKVVFIHGRGIEFIRFFDKATGRLVMTETENGGQIRERGEQIISGIRFPTSLESTFDERTVVITFESIEVNGDYPNSLFEVPSVMPMP
ncbi:MAG TPA: hypothetical protein VMM36_15030 [Opitutaceae bacterium]|nr:hypothetical protein [Opitutaceae bacterium]